MGLGGRDIVQMENNVIPKAKAPRKGGGMFIKHQALKWLYFLYYEHFTE